MTLSVARLSKSTARKRGLVSTRLWRVLLELFEGDVSWSLAMTNRLRQDADFCRFSYTQVRPYGNTDVFSAR